MIQARNILFQLTDVNLEMESSTKRENQTNEAVPQKRCDSVLSGQNCALFHLVLVLERDCD